MIIDIHTHIGVSWKRTFHNIYPSSQTVKDLVLKMELYGIDYAVTFPFTSTLYDDPRYYNELVPIKFMDFPFKVENELMLSQIKHLGKGKLLPFLIIDPKRKVKKQITQIEKWLKEYNIYGLKVHTKATRTRGDEMIGSPFMDLAKKHGLPILFHSYLQDITHPLPILKLALEYPEINICIAHWGGFIQEFYNELDRSNPKNLFIDTSPIIANSLSIEADAKKRGFKILDINYPDPKCMILDMMKKYEDRIIFGTDEPFTTYINPLEGENSIFSDLGKELETLKGLNKDLFEKITYKNAKRFLGKRAERKLI